MPGTDYHVAGFEAYAEPSNAIEVNRETGCEKGDGRSRKPLSCLAKRHVGQGYDQPTVCYASSIAVIVRNSQAEDDTGLCTPLHKGTDPIEKSARLGIGLKSRDVVVGAWHARRLLRRAVMRRDVISVLFLSHLS